MKAKLSMAFEDLRGKDGNVVITKKRSGLTLTPHTTPRNPKTSAQSGVRRAMTLASKTYEGMTNGQVAAWEAYGATITRHNPITGKAYTSTGIAAFIELATKFLQMAPNGTIPVTPPTTEFLGDTITVTASTTPGIVTFTASAPNALGVNTEVLLQKIANGHREPSAKAYVSKGFQSFASGTLTKNVSVPAGYYAAAYRFVKIATGQATEIVTLPIQFVALSLEDGGQAEASQAAAKPAKAAKAPELKKAA